MKTKETISRRSKEAKLLDQRIAENVAAQEIDLVDWIFKRLAVKRGAYVLDLCCGTGAQTLRLLPLVGEAGHTVALDVSREALDALISKVDAAWLPALTVIEGNMDELGQLLSRAGLPRPCFDLIFCAYGLYYSSDARRVLQEAKRWLKPKGAMVIVGPFGSNNGPLFKLLQRSGVSIPAFVKYSSQGFMYDEVIPWATENFPSVAISTVVNHIKWTSPERMLNYWQNSTFYKAEKRETVRKQVDKHFESYGQFTNEKWIMMVEMTHART